MTTILGWSGVVVIYAATLAFSYRAGFIDGGRKGRHDLVAKAIIKQLCVILSCSRTELAVLIKAARDTAGQESTGVPLDELVWGVTHIGLLQAEKERMR